MTEYEGEPIREGDWVEFMVNAPEEYVGEVGRVVSVPKGESILIDFVMVELQDRERSIVQANCDWLGMAHDDS